jgi:uncharacterized protein (TIGR03435 family)
MKALFAIFFILPTGSAFAQTPVTTAFEVVSVKPNTSGSRRSGTHTLSGGRRFVANNITVRQLILEAYDLRGLQLIGGPAWIDSDHFDIDASAPEYASLNQFLPMLHALLADRFKLLTHTETKEQPIYALVPARADKKLGAQIKESALDCTSSAPSKECGMNTNLNNGGGDMKGGGLTLADLAAWLAGFVTDRMVIDRTGLTGLFDFELRWTPQSLQAAQPNPADGAKTPDAPPIFVALPEQLGLKLEAQRGPVKFVVIDSVQHPEPN